MSDNLTLYLSSSQVLLKAMSTYFKLYDINAQINNIQNQVSDLIQAQEGINNSVEIVTLVTELLKLNKQKERINNLVNSGLVESISILLKMIDNLLLNTNEEATELSVCQKHLQAIYDFSSTCDYLDFSTLIVDIYRIVDACREKKKNYWDNIAQSLSKLLSLSANRG